MCCLDLRAGLLIWISEETTLGVLVEVSRAVLIGRGGRCFFSFVREAVLSIEVVGALLKVWLISWRKVDSSVIAFSLISFEFLRSYVLLYKSSKRETAYEGVAVI